MGVQYLPIEFFAILTGDFCLMPKPNTGKNLWQLFFLSSQSQTTEQKEVTEPFHRKKMQQVLTLG